MYRNLKISPEKSQEIVLEKFGESQTGKTSISINNFYRNFK